MSEVLNEKIFTKDYKSIIAIGDIISTNSDGHGITSKRINGYVGEMSADCFFIWQDIYPGRRGYLDPREENYKYSWQAYFDSPGYVIIDSKFTKTLPNIKEDYICNNLNEFMMKLDFLEKKIKNG